ncbi:MAG: small basic protein [Verrucomicrobiota bacterium]
MSQHRSLRGSGTIKAKKSVLPRSERIKLMKKRGQWKAGQKPWNLPKTKAEE